MSTTLPAPAPPPPLHEPPGPPPAAPRNSPRRTGVIIGGSVAALIAVVLLLAGGGLLWVQGEKDADGYLSTDTHRLATSTYALASENLDAELDGPSWLSTSDAFGKVRVRAQARNGKRVFVGIARTADVQRYLRGAAHETITDVETSPFRTESRTTGGGRPATQPWDESFWASASYGTGVREVTWRVRDGDWSVVVMNADGSAGVDAGVRAGADVPFLGPAGWITLGGGLVLLAGAGGLLYLGIRKPPRTRPERVTEREPVVASV